MVRFSSLLLIAAGAALLAQQQPGNPPPATAVPQAPPALDQALRSRVQFFFQAHVDAKWRLADQVVAEDSKDNFFAMQKPRVLSFDIAKIEYSDNFQRAKVTVNCEEDMIMMGAGSVRLKMPRSSDWKLENGEWFWYFDPNAVRETPFGPMKYLTNGAPGEQSPPTQLTMPQGPSAKDIQTSIKLDKMEVSLKSNEPSSDTVTVSNGMPGWVTLALQLPELPGLDVKVDQKNVKAGQQAHITFRFDPSAGAAPPSEVVNLLVNPTGMLFAIHVTFQAPAPATGKQPH
jgi:hypothetical protein